MYVFAKSQCLSVGVVELSSPADRHRHRSPTPPYLNAVVYGQWQLRLPRFGHQLS